ncbi:UUP1 family membrane protein [Qipengyuania sp. GH1]|uniref:UUP1 family membrane protein n=1 Tax=Qipengyuania aestuarii TaxID=2867241 RepID=UPI001C86D250|nr:UUP1 family membrane protein [Qipengyuania aestuarii]MBX7535121.1 UUP1 family membrane protein [Qipengyuania aestuarii]
MHFRVIVIALLAMGIGLFLFRWLGLDYPLLPDEETSLWRLEVQLEMQNGDEIGRLAMFAPTTDERYGLVSEELVSNGVPVLFQQRLNGNRQAIWTLSEPGQRATVIYRGLYERRPRLPDAPASAAPPSQEGLSTPLPGLREMAAEGLAREMRSGDGPQEDRVLALLYRLREAPDAQARALVGEANTVGRRVRAAARILNLSGIPARTAHGLLLTETLERAAPTAWLEVWDGDRWTTYDADRLSSDIERNMLVWWRGDDALYQATNARDAGIRIAVAEQTVGSVDTLRDAPRGSSFFSAFSFFNMTINSQLVFQLLVMIPVGVIVLVVCRQMIGIPTLGTFMPVLIALVFLISGPVYGMLFFVSLVALGLLARLYLAQLDLMLVPRLAAMLVIVIALLAIFSVVADRWSLGLGLSISLFPVVIMTMTIERMSVTWEENGPAEALQEGVGSLFVALLAWFVMQIDVLKHLFFVFPETMLILLAILLMLGRYTGYRLTEFHRFRDFGTAEKQA